MRQDAAFQMSIELVFDKLGQVSPGVRSDLGEKRRELFLRDRMERRFLVPVAVVSVADRQAMP